MAPAPQRRPCFRRPALYLGTVNLCCDRLSVGGATQVDTSQTEFPEEEPGVSNPSSLLQQLRAVGQCLRIEPFASETSSRRTALLVSFVSHLY